MTTIEPALTQVRVLDVNRIMGYLTCLNNTKLVLTVGSTNIPLNTEFHVFCDIPSRLRLDYNIKIHLFEHGQQICGDSIEIINHKESATDKKRRRVYRRDFKVAFTNYLQKSEYVGFGNVLLVWLANEAKLIQISLTN